MVRYAVERALVQLARVDAAIAARITDRRNIIAFRNILVHAYAHTDDRIVWDIVEYKLPVLIREVGDLMNQPDDPS